MKVERTNRLREDKQKGDESRKDKSTERGQRKGDENKKEKND
jgi:hypothetical protein